MTLLYSYSLGIQKDGYFIPIPRWDWSPWHTTGGYFIPIPRWDWSPWHIKGGYFIPIPRWDWSPWHTKGGYFTQFQNGTDPWIVRSLNGSCWQIKYGICIHRTYFIGDWLWSPGNSLIICFRKENIQLAANLTAIIVSMLNVTKR